MTAPHLVCRAWGFVGTNDANLHTTTTGVVRGGCTNWASPDDNDIVHRSFFLVEYAQ
jgi:hypothetical protein